MLMHRKERTDASQTLPYLENIAKNAIWIGAK